MQWRAQKLAAWRFDEMGTVAKKRERERERRGKEAQRIISRLP